MARTSGSGNDELFRIARRAMQQRGLLPDFGNAVERELDAIRQPAAPPTGSATRDLRDRLWCSIDNDDSRDLDQLTVAEPIADGAVKILVAIADVDALVKRGTALDGHARMNTTSVYTAAGVFSMLPVKLSTDLTSLGEDDDRLAVVTEMTVDGDGAVKSFEVYRALVRNHAKLAYNSVAGWLDNTGPPPARVSAVRGLDEQLRMQDRVAQSLKEVRHARGALNLETLEVHAVFDDGRLTGMVPDRKNRARELIEDFMIAANGATAKFLERNHSPSLRRILRVPKRWDRIVELAAAAGETLPQEPDAVALDAFLRKEREKDPERFCDLSLSVVKLLGKGEYVPDMPGQKIPGHFGLAVNDYTHSTAPNRRFPDVIAQRLVKSALGEGPVPYGGDELAELASHCTLQEDNAAKVERQVRKSAAALLLANRIGNTFDAMVTGASIKGTWVRIANPAVEGRVVRGFEGMDVGDRVRVTLVHTDVERGFIDFNRAPG